MHNRQILFSHIVPVYRSRSKDGFCDLFGGSSVEFGIVHGRMESPNSSLQAIELNSCCAGRPRLNVPGTGPGHESTVSGCTLTVYPPLNGHVWHWQKNVGVVISKGRCCDLENFSKTRPSDS